MALGQSAQGARATERLTTNTGWTSECVQTSKEQRVSGAYEDGVASKTKSRRKGGRPRKVDPIKVVRWRRKNKATIAETAAHFGISKRTVANAQSAWIAARDDWRAEQIAQADKLTAYVEAQDAARLAALRELLADRPDEGPDQD